MTLVASLSVVRTPDLAERAVVQCVEYKVPVACKTQ